MKATDVTALSARVPCGPSMTCDALNLALAFLKHEIECKTDDRYLPNSNVFNQDRHLSNKSDTFAACVKEKKCSLLCNNPYWV